MKFIIPTTKKKNIIKVINSSFFFEFEKCSIGKTPSNKFMNSLWICGWFFKEPTQPREDKLL